MGKPTAYRCFAGFAAAVALLAVPVVALGALPRAGGHYKGHTTARGVSYKGPVSFVVTADRAHFASGKVWVDMKGGAAGLGSCVGTAYFTLSATKARQISLTGTFNLGGTFPFAVPVPKYISKSGHLYYKGRATIKGHFSASGKQVSGTAQEWASSRRLSCKSGPVHFTAALVSG